MKLVEKQNAGLGVCVLNTITASKNSSMAFKGPTVKAGEAFL